MSAIDVFPAGGEVVDLEAAGLAFRPGTFRTARNVRFRDDSTPERRPGFYSHHRPFTVGALNGLLTDYECLSCYQFNKTTSVHSQIQVFLAQVQNYVVGSYGANISNLTSGAGMVFDMPLWDGAGVRAVLDWNEYYSVPERRNYLIVCSDVPAVFPHYWDGQFDPNGNVAHDRPDWQFFRAMQGVPAASFARIHNGRAWYGGGDPYLAWYSLANDFRVIEGALPVDPAFGKITGFFPTYYGEFFIGQESAINRVTFNSLGVPDTMFPITTENGLANNRSMVRIGNDFLYITTKGQVAALSTTAAFGDVLFQSKSFKVWRKFEKAIHAARRWAFAIDDPCDQIAWFSISQGSGARNDALLGYDYNRDRWIEDENKTIGGFSAGAVFDYARFNGRKKAVLSSFRVGLASPGRIWTHYKGLKEDAYLTDVVVSNDTAAPNYLLPRKKIPTLGFGTGWPDPGGTQVTLSGTYSGAATGSTTIRVKLTSTGSAATTALIGTTVGMQATWRDIRAGTTGTINIGSVYTPGNPIALTGGISITFVSAQTVTIGQEIWILIDRAQKMTEVYSPLLPDLYEGWRIKKLGGLTTFNFVPVLETPDFYFGQPHVEFHVEGITVITRVVGNRADVVANGDGSSTNQNQWRHYLDMYFMADSDRDWQMVACLDGNAAKKRHLDPSLSENAGDHAERKSLQIQLPSLPLENLGHPMARDEDVNMEFVKIGRSVKRFRLRFDQWTAASIDVGANNGQLGWRNGDFNLIGYQVHLKPTRAGGRVDEMGSMSRKFDLAGV